MIAVQWSELNLFEWKKLQKKMRLQYIYSSDWLCESNIHRHIWHLYNLYTGEYCTIWWMAGGEELVRPNDAYVCECECDCACNWAGKISSHNIEIEYRHNRHEVYTHSVCVSLCEEWPEKANEIKIKTKNRQPIVIACWTHAEIFSAVLNLAAINFNLVRNKFIEMEFR